MSEREESKKERVVDREREMAMQQVVDETDLISPEFCHWTDRLVSSSGGGGGGLGW